ncbi:TonB-dependent receptor domain-containing protein [Bacteroides pyogenes]|uniref:outer membrane beta-barrel family protein n=1 Tax=Bacteroides pyogenes TaxID=310300 RepID=UPI0011E41A51|nr:outer membrane beta-barrel family protein [Bacteroides pyogenes]MBR8706327.1 hypothetical protein [Bacteroides pyogenes]TYK36270.1 TonB-dependent receptor [Bacteroides pyogenes]
MKKVALIILGVLMQFSIIAQIKGVVLDFNDYPIEFANVALYSLPDSALISGTVTNKDGVFTIENANTKNAFIKVSMIGFQTATLTNISKTNLDTIVLSESSQMLNEVVIKGSRPIYKMESDGLVTRIENTVLSQLGTANDVLAQLPFVLSSDGQLSVFGRGTPLVYLNNRLIRDKDELKLLKSSDIKDVKIILNPGSQYDASVGAVIRITTVKPLGEGVSATLYTFLRKRRNFDHYEYLDLNYRKGRLDLFGKVSFDKTVSQQNQEDELTLNLEKTYLTQDNIKIKSNSQSWETTLGANYAFLPTHLIGFRYMYLSSPTDNWDFRGKTNHYENEINDNSYTSINITDRKTHRHYFNMYYHHELKNKATIHFEGDYVNGESKTNQSSDYQNRLNDEFILVKNNNTSDYSLYAGKLTIEKPFLKGNLSFGSESSFTDNKQSVIVVSDDVSVNLPSSKDRSEQFLIATFATYDYTWNNISLNGGLRYEYIDYKYYYNVKLNDEQSRIYNNWFPTFSFSYRNEQLNMALGYKTIVRRPNYFNLRSSITYNSPYSYEGGNPSLKQMFTNKLSYTFGWKDFQLDVSYNWIKDNLMFIGRQFEDKPISFFTMMNLPHSEIIDGYISYSPKIKFWRPLFSVGFRKQYLKYDNKTYNKPYCSYTWNNIFDLPNNFRFILNVRGNLKGNYDVSVYNSSFRTDARISRSFFNNQLDVVLSATDIFATDLEKWSMDTDTIYYDKWNDRDNRGFILQLTYKFNSAKSKYKGTGAGASEINRL